MLDLAQKVDRGELALNNAIGPFVEKYPSTAPLLINFITSYQELGSGKRLYSRLDSQLLRAMLEAIAQIAPQDLYIALQALEAGFEPLGRKKREPPMGSQRVFLREYQERLAGMMPLARTAASFDADVKRAISQLPAARAARLAAAPRKPKVVMRLVQDFERNPDVVAEVLYRAQGYCEDCGNPAPFLRRSDWRSTI